MAAALAELTREESDKIYNRFRSTNFNDGVLASFSAIRNNPEILKKINKSADDLAPAFRLYARVAHQYDSGTFFESITTGELPPMKLSPTEMEFLHGGGEAETIGRIISMILFGS